MKTFLVPFLAAALLAAASVSAAAGWTWAGAGHTTPDIGSATGTSAARNSSGSLITVGTFKDKIDFGNGQILYSSGGEDMFLAIYNSSGVCQKAVGAIGLGNDGANSVSVDSSNNIYVTGYFNVTCDFGNGNYLVAGGDASDVFVVKYNSSGVCQWAQKITGDTNGSEGLSVFAYGSLIYVTGTVGAPTRQNLFVAQFDANTGTMLWGTIPSCTGNAQGTSIVYSSATAAAVTGYFSGTINFGGGNSITSNGGYDIFIAQYDKEGTCLWAKKAGGPGLDVGTAVACDANPYFYVCGYFDDVCSFGNGIFLTSLGKNDIFLAQYDKDGVCQWASKAGGLNDDQAFCLAVNPVSKVETQIFMAGAIRGFVDFGNDITLDTGGLPSHCFLAEYDIDGLCQMAVQVDGDTNAGYGLAINKSAPALYLAGDFRGTAWFGSSISLSSTGIGDSFIACYDATVPKANLTMALSPAGSGTTVPAAGTSSVTIGKPHQISAAPAPGYKFDNWTATADATIADPGTATTTVTIADDATVTANFIKIPISVNLTMAANPAEGGTSTPPAGISAVTAGQPQNISATANEGYQFTAWTATENATVEEPDSAATTVTLTGDATVTANFAVLVSLTMASDPAEGGTTVPATGVTTVPAGVPQSISASAAAGYTFLSWSASAAASIANKNSANTTATLSDDATVTAKFAADVTLTMASDPAEGGTTTPPAGQSKVPYGKPQSITATSVKGYVFKEWTSTDGAAIANKGSAVTTATLTSDAAVTANFKQIPPDANLTMAVNPEGAGMTVPPAGTSIVNTQEDISISATANDGYVFTSWDATADADVADKSSPTTTVSIIGDSTVTANFAATAVLTMAVTPDGKGITVPPVGTSTVIANVAFDIAASPASAYMFSAWNAGAGATVEKPSSSHTTATLSHDATITAVFVRDPDLAVITMEVSPAGAGATIPQNSQTVHIGTDTPISAAANEGFTFVNWSAGGPGASFADVTAPNTTVSVSGDITITANFLAAAPAADTSCGKIYGLSVNDIQWPSPEQKLADFAKKPKVYATYTANGKTRKTTLSIPAKFTVPVTEVDCEWNASIPILDKKVWADKTLTTQQILDNHQPLIPITCSLFVTGQDTKGVKVKDLDTQIDLLQQPPTISRVIDKYGDTITSVAAGAGVKITIIGMMFGKNLPAVWLEYESNGKVKQYKLKIDKEAFRFPNAKGKSCCMDIKTGASELTVLIPQQWPKNWQPGDHNIVIDNKICRASYAFQTK